MPRPCTTIVSGAKGPSVGTCDELGERVDEHLGAVAAMDDHTLPTAKRRGLQKKKKKKKKRGRAPDEDNRAADRGGHGIVTRAPLKKI